MLIAVESQVLPDELVDDQILIGEIRTVGRRVIESTEDLSSYPGPDL